MQRCLQSTLPLFPSKRNTRIIINGVKCAEQNAALNYNFSIS